MVRVPRRIQARDFGTQRAQVGRIWLGDRADREREAVRHDRIAFGDAFERVGIVAAAPKIVFGRDLEEGNVMDWTVQHFFEEFPAQPQPDSTECWTFAGLGRSALGHAHELVLSRRYQRRSLLWRQLPSSCLLLLWLCRLWRALPREQCSELRERLPLQLPWLPDLRGSLRLRPLRLPTWRPAPLSRPRGFQPRARGCPHRRRGPR